MYALINGRIFTGEKTIFNRVVIIDGEKIKEVVKSENLDDLYPNIEKKDIDGNLIAPAFIDLQLNGCGGVLLNEDISINTFKVMNETNIKHGCTLYTPTLITCADEKIERALQLMEEIED